MFDYSSKKATHKYAVAFDGARGSIEVFREGLVMHRGDRQIAVRNNYVQSLSQTSTEPLSKVGAQITYYDMFGNMETVGFQIREIDFRALKQDLGK